ncbi:MAG: chromate efflux transporter [Deferribacterales bacterium]
MRINNLFEIFSVFLSLGVRSFGGPVAHMGYFHREFVDSRKWLSEKEFADLAAMCQFLPGPASSQTGFAIGLKKGGMAGAFAAWLGFTAPSAFVMAAAAYGLGSFGFLKDSFVIPGLLMLTVAVVAQAVWSMGVKLCSENRLRLLAAASAAAVLVLSHPLVQVLVIILAGAAGYVMYRNTEPSETPASKLSFSTPLFMLTVFFVLLGGLPLLAAASDNHNLKLFEIFYRAGSLVFGGGHVVLPLLQAETAGGHYLTDEIFLSGYGIAQLVPGPLFTFASFVGTSAGGIITGIMCLIGVFMSTFLLVPAVLPFWDHLSSRSWASAALKGVNAGVVGILLAALYNPVWVKGVHSGYDFAVCVAAFALLMYRKTPVWMVAMFCIAFAYLKQVI